MAITDFFNLAKVRPLSPVTPRAFRMDLLRVCRTLFASCIFLGSACHAQDVSGAAKKEQSRNNPKQRHTYTEEDLRRLRILTPEDRARAEAPRKYVSAAKPTPTEALDANAESAQPSLGDVARKFRKQKQARQLRPEGPFHLPFSEPAFASPVLPEQPKFVPSRPNVTAQPSAPVVTPNRPSEIVPAARLKSPPVRRVDPFAKRFTPPTPPTVVPPRSPAIIAAEPRASAPTVPQVQAEGARSITVQPGDSLWTLAEKNLGRGSRWQELMAANPGIVNADRIVARRRIYLPTNAHSARPAKITVQLGDTLSKIAQSQYGRLAAWRCIAQANPQITDANRIFAGQELSLPLSCNP